MKDNTIREKSNSFEVVQLGSFRKDQLLIDKKTGQMWQPVCMFSKSKDTTDCDYTAWKKIDIEDINIPRDAINAWADALKAQSQKK